MPDYTFDEIRSNEINSIKNGGFAIIGISIVSNFAPLFALQALHATSSEIALLSALPALMAIVSTWIGATLLSRVSGKKKICVEATSVARVFYALIAVLPFFVHGPFLAVAVVLAISAMNFPQSISNLAWQSLIGDLIPGDRRADFFGVRNRILTFVGMLATLLPGIALQMFPVSSIPPYQVLFGLSFAFSIFEIYYLILHREHVDRSPDWSGLGRLDLRRMAGYFRKGPYQRFLVGSIIFNLGWQMAWPLFSIYQIRYAGATALWISAFNVANQISQIATFRYWGRLSRRYGNTMTLGVAAIGLATAPILTVASKNLYYLLWLNLATGTFVAGVNMLQFNHLLEVVPEGERTPHIAHFNIVIGAVGFLAPEIGVWMLHALRMDLSMTVSAIVRALGAGFFFLTFRAAVRAVRTQGAETGQ